MKKVIMKKFVKVVLGVLGVTATVYFFKQEKRTIKNLRRNIDELIKKKMV